MRRLTTKQCVQVISALVEGNSIRATVRMTEVAKNTVVKLLADIGRVCAEYQDRAFQNLPCRRLQADEVWSFCYAKQKNVPVEKQDIFGFGDIYTWMAICADTKLVPCWHLGRRDTPAAVEFISDWLHGCRIEYSLRPMAIDRT